MAPESRYEAFFLTVQKACLPGVWSKGVALARDKAVLRDQATDEQLSLRVKNRGGAVSAKVSLWPGDEDWFCDCGDRADPCMHVAAAVAALRNDWALAADAPAEGAVAPGSDRILYALVRVDGGLALERWIERGGKKELLTQSLVALIGGIRSGRIAAATPAATQEDFAIDQAVGPPSRTPLSPAALAQLLKALRESAQVLLDGVAIQVSGRPVTVWARVRDEGAGFRIQGERDAGVTETFRNGAALCGSTLHPFPVPLLSPLERECVSRTGKFIPLSDGATLVTELLPDLERKLRVEIETRRLPRLCEEPPRIELRMEEEAPGTLSVFPVLVYGAPAIAEIHQDQVHPLRPELIPLRDPARERELTRRLQAELNLQPSHRVRLSGEAAVRFVARCGDWDATGPGLRAFGVKTKLKPSLRVSERDGTLEFELLFQDAGTGAPAADANRVLRAWSEGQSFVPLLDGGWAPLPQGWLERYGARVQALLESRENGASRARIAPELQPDLARLCEELDAPCPRSLQRLRETLEQFEGIPEAPLPADLRAELRGYQKKGVDWLHFVANAGMGAMLADDMGLGKTLQALASMRGRTLVVCPTSVLQTWVEQVERFRPGLRHAVYHGAARELLTGPELILTTYGILRLDQDRLAQESWDTVILDEAQMIRNPESQIARAAHRLDAPLRIALSGTPVENRLDDLWSQFRFLNPGLLGTRESFEERYSGPIARGDLEAAQELRRRIRPFILRRLKREVAPELPPRTETVLRCELSPAERELYDSVLAATRKEVLARLQEGGGVFAALEALLRLRQACCHPALVPGSLTENTPGSAESSSKVQLLLQSLESSLALGHRALVFSQWTSFLDLIGEELTRSGITYCRLDGATRDREGVVREFQSPDGPPVMLLSLKAGGVGITLTAADHVYLMDPWWNPAAEDQAADRAHRIGQENPVLIHRLVAEGTVEDRILLLQKRKLELASAVLEGSGAALSITRDDLLALLT